MVSTRTWTSEKSMGHGAGSHPEDEQAYQEAIANQNSALIVHNEQLEESLKKLLDERSNLSRLVFQAHSLCCDTAEFSREKIHRIIQEMQKIIS